MQSRKLLLLQSEVSNTQLASVLRERGWNVTEASRLDEAHSLVREDRFSVGLVALDSSECYPKAAIERLISASRIDWIALVAKDLLQDQRYSRMILELFCDYSSLPLDYARLGVVLGHADGRSVLRRTLTDPSAEAGRYGMVGQSRLMRQLYARLDRICQADAPVLISGESGTGKELVARAIHRYSTRAQGPFVPVNCGGLPPNLVHSELFGYERGAFTGAHQRKIGSLEAASGGVVFLDEIGDLPLELQANLLRFLEERTIVRLGSTKRVHIDVRVVTATHVDLHRAVSQGKFREDLFYRLNVLQLTLPPLRERVGDIELFSRVLMQQLAEQKSPMIHGFSQSALEAMRAYGWPGNVRELINRVQRALIMGEHRLVMPEDLGLAAPASDSNVVRLWNARAAAERDMIQLTLRANDNNISKAARELGVSRVTLYRLMDKLDITPKQSGGTSL